MAPAFRLPDSDQAKAGSSSPGNGVAGHPGMKSFPDLLEAVPADERLGETIGVGFGAFAVGALVVLGGYWLRMLEAGFDPTSAKFAAGALAVALVSGTLEVLRRRRPVALVPRGPELGVYRGGRFVRTIARNQLTLYRLNLLNTVRELFAFGMLGFVATIGSVAFFASSDRAGTELAWALGAAVAFDLTAYSSFLTRVLSRQYFLPRDLSSGELVFSKAALRRLGLEP
ncbi:MAG: hypothetical protein ACYC8T_05775 [Myxococcaceae bacterium]